MRTAILKGKKRGTRGGEGGLACKVGEFRKEKYPTLRNLLKSRSQAIGKLRLQEGKISGQEGNYGQRR